YGPLVVSSMCYLYALLATLPRTKNGNLHFIYIDLHFYLHMLGCQGYIKYHDKLARVLVIVGNRFTTVLLMLMLRLFKSMHKIDMELTLAEIGYTNDNLNNKCVIHLILVSLPKEFDTFIINYNMNSEKWIIEKLIIIFMYSFQDERQRYKLANSTPSWNMLELAQMK
ncbi:hypothetical protein ACJX0J_040567, partial [Zea mays]